MQLTVREVAALLNVSEKTVYRWIKKGGIPAYRLNDQYRFHRAELLEWATANKIGVSVAIFDENGDSPACPVTLSEALQNGGIIYRVAGDDKTTVLQLAVEAMRLPEEVDREQLLRVLLAREALASTGIGDGIAVPHVRNPIVLHVPHPTITLCFLERPLDFGALDGQPVHCLFTMVSPTVRAHLHLLSRLAFALRDPGFKAVITRQALRDDVFAELRRVESGFVQPLGAPAPVV
ncbi:MAG: PTS fructose transporter subunit IIA [Deltaproteobacteria bacterium RIFOXYA12_FULL_58_15]|nr:MAG: PTS fructose transporter subunit IIA [Deltaproteobacteria bacterium RIFOXYA12_FULL_58_15]OGR10183.1 MAG: PTS fructose transporter subunit IIA [Deltaproteobacteria bacterium RIFOXYB12_FULL_58_9]